MSSAKELAQNVDQLISFPEVAIRVNEMVADGASSADDLGAVIEKDPGLSATLLRVANSAFYNVGAEITDISKAFTRIGSSQVQELTLGICATRAFAGIPNELVSVEDFWRHSLMSAVAARLIAKQAKKRAAGMVFTAGLLHDVGHLVMFQQRPEQSSTALAKSRDEFNGHDVFRAEREVFGFDHMAVGSELARLWNWPDTLANCIQRHHNPFEFADYSDSDVIVHAANGVATLAELDADNFEDAPIIDPRTWDYLKLVPESLVDLKFDVISGVAELSKLFLA